MRLGVTGWDLFRILVFDGAAAMDTLVSRRCKNTTAEQYDPDICILEKLCFTDTHSCFCATNSFCCSTGSVKWQSVKVSLRDRWMMLLVVDHSVGVWNSFLSLFISCLSWKRRMSCYKNSVFCPPFITCFSWWASWGRKVFPTRFRLPNGYFDYTKKRNQTKVSDLL